MRRKIGWMLSLLILAATGVFGLYNGVRELAGAETPLQHSVTIGVILYGGLGLAAALAMLAGWPSSVWLAAAWGVVITYVSSTAAFAYAGADATLGGAIGSGIGGALIAAGVIWGARARRGGRPRGADAGQAPVIGIAALLAACAPALGSCQRLYTGPPVVRDRGEEMVTKRVRAKREPDRLIAEDLSVCWVIPEVFATIAPGASWRCAWRHVPEGH